MLKISQPRVQPATADNAWAEINLRQLRDNVAVIREHCGKQVKMMAVVKADGYGHGAAKIAAAALEAGAEALAVATVQEGAELRRCGIAAPILILGHFSEGQIPMLFDHALIASITSYADADRLSAYGARAGLACDVHLRVDVAGSGVGALPEQALPLAESIAGMAALQLDGVYTHLASAYTNDASAARAQLVIFQSLVLELQYRGHRFTHIHAASSPAMLTMPEARYTMVRAGILMYGLPVMDNQPPLPVRPIMQIKTRIASLKRIDAGVRHGYGGKHQTDSAILAAVLTIGYGDYPFLFHMAGGEALIRGARAPYLGQVYMDHLLVDVSAIPGVAAGDEAVIMGEQDGEMIGAEELAKRAGIGALNCDFVCLPGTRITRIYIEENNR